MRLSRLFTPTRLVIVAATVVAALMVAVRTALGELAAADTAPGAQFVASTGRILDRDIIYASWYDSNYSNVGHAGVISLVTGTNIYIDQRSTEHYRESRCKVSGNPHTWQGWYSHVHVWILNPAGER